MKFPEFDELGNMIGQGFDSGAKVLNNPGVQGLLAAGLGAASQVGKRNVGPLNTLGAAGLAGLGAYGLGRNVNSRNKYNLARIKQLQEGQDQEAAKLQLAAEKKAGQEAFLGGETDLVQKGQGMEANLGSLTSQLMNTPYSTPTPTQVPYELGEQDRHPDAARAVVDQQQQIRDHRNKLDSFRRSIDNPNLADYLKQGQSQGVGTDGQNFKGIATFKFKQKLRTLDAINGTNLADEFTNDQENLRLIDLDHKKLLVSGRTGETVREEAVGIKPVDTVPHKVSVARAVTSVTERTKNAEKIYNDYALSGKGEIVAGNIKRLDSAMEVLKRTPNFTGGKFEFMPDSAIKLLYPDVWEAKQAVELVIQPTLKETLGAQMSEQEGVRVFDRSTALALSPEANYRKWSLLAKQVKATHEAKMAVVKYIHEHGSLDGFKGKLPNQIEYTDKALGWDKLDGYEESVKEMELDLYVGPGANKRKRKPFSDKSKEERFQEFRRLNQ